MATTVADRAVLDTNVLHAATESKRAGHRAARSLLASRAFTFYTSGQIIREYLVVATRPLSVNGMGMTGSQALANVRSLRARLALLPEDERIAARLLALVGDVGVMGRQIHDANIVATMLVHGIDVLITADGRDFNRFGDLIQVIDLADVATTR